MISIPALKTNAFNVRPPTAIDVLKGADSTSGTTLWSMNMLLGSITPADFMQQQSAYKKSVQDFSAAAKSLNDAATTTTSSLFAAKKVTTTGAAVSGTAKTGATLTDYTVGVTQLATTQRNDGKAVNGGAYGALNSGNYTVGVKLGSGTEKQLMVNVAATDTNKTVLGKFAKVFNAANAGVEATVRTDKNGANYLSVESKTTGAAQSFTLRDIGGNAVNALGLNAQAQTAGNAAYTVNGKAYTATTNQLKLDNGNVTLNLNAVTNDKNGKPTTVQATVGNDANGVVSAAKKLVDAYNKMTDTLSGNELTARGLGMSAALGGVVSNANKASLAKIGITQDSETGKLAIDETKLTTALNSNADQVKQALTGGNGLAGRVAKLSKQMVNMPTDQYLQAPANSNLQTYNSQAQLSNLQMLLGNQQTSWRGLFMDMMV